LDRPTQSDEQQKLIDLTREVTTFWRVYHPVSSVANVTRSENVVARTGKHLQSREKDESLATCRKPGLPSPAWLAHASRLFRTKRPATPVFVFPPALPLPPRYTPQVPSNLQRNNRRRIPHQAISETMSSVRNQSSPPTQPSGIAKREKYFANHPWISAILSRRRDPPKQPYAWRP